MNSLPDYLEEHFLILRKAFPNAITEEEVEIIIFLLQGNFSQRNVALLISGCFGLDFYKTLNIVQGAGTNEGERNSLKVIEIKEKLAKSGYDL